MPIRSCAKTPFFLPIGPVPDIRGARVFGRNRTRVSRFAAIAQLVEHVIRKDIETALHPSQPNASPSHKSQKPLIYRHYLSAIRRLCGWQFRPSACIHHLTRCSKCGPVMPRKRANGSILRARQSRRWRSPNRLLRRRLPPGLRSGFAAAAKTWTYFFTWAANGFAEAGHLSRDVAWPAPIPSPMKRRGRPRSWPRSSLGTGQARDPAGQSVRNTSTAKLGGLRTGDDRKATLERLVYPTLGDRPISDIRRSRDCAPP